MKPWASDRLLLDQQTCADFHVSADTERIYTLIANSGDGARANDLPVIILCPLIDHLHWIETVKSEQIQPAVVINVSDVKQPVIRQARLKQIKLAITVV